MSQAGSARPNAQGRIRRARVTHRLDVVAVRIADEGPVVVLVIFGEHPWRIEDFGADGNCGLVEGVDGVTVGGPEGHMEFPVFIPLRGR